MCVCVCRSMNMDGIRDLYLLTSSLLCVPAPHHNTQAYCEWTINAPNRAIKKGEREAGMQFFSSPTPTRNEAKKMEHKNIYWCVKSVYETPQFTIFPTITTSFPFRSISNCAHTHSLVRFLVKIFSGGIIRSTIVARQWQNVLRINLTNIRPQRLPP